VTRPYAAERRSLRLHDWPQRDQELLARAIAPGGLLDDGGRGAAWMPKTYHGYVWTYGRWLTFLKLNLGSNLRDDPPERATRENLAAFIAILREQGVASSTIFDYLKGVYVMLWAMLPEHDWSWLDRRFARHQACLPRRLQSHGLRRGPDISRPDPASRRIP